jgi:hypothetical protein
MRGKQVRLQDSCTSQIAQSSYGVFFLFERSSKPYNLQQLSCKQACRDCLNSTWQKKEQKPSL